MSRQLFERFAAAAGRDYTRDEVIEAAANLLLNALRQKHDRLADAEDELFNRARDMAATLKRDHYTKDGVRNGLVVVGPAVTNWLRSEGVEL